MIRSALLLCLAAATARAAEWQPVAGRIMTRWAKDVTPQNAWTEHPRPQMVREQWKSLNGLWEYGIQGESRQWDGSRVENAAASPLLQPQTAAPANWDGKILVPYAIESALSGAGKIVRPNQQLWYRRAFTVPATWRGRRVLLNFQAVDWHAVVFVNGRRAGDHKGGYTPFQFDITSLLTDSGPQELLVAVWDPTNTGDQGIGKQSLPELRKGYRYTPTTGIWQTVWLEAVPTTHISRLKILPDVDGKQVKVEAAVAGPATELSVSVAVMEGARTVASARGVPGSPIAVKIRSPKLWSPGRPHLYDLKVTLGGKGAVIDSVASYFGMRKIEIRPDAAGVVRYYLNNEILPFQFGPLDQGYWPDGILTPPTDAAAAFDVQYLKDIACNMARVHVKVHPDRWYYHCDRLGLLVWQDMVCTRRFEGKITPASASQWEAEQREMIDFLHNHPSIIQWVIFNESWGQYDTERLTRWAKSYDPSRLVTCASGWNDVPGLGDVRDIHDYSFFPSIPPAAAEKTRVIVLGEFGGFDVPMKGHLWHADQAMAPKSDRKKELPRETYASPKEWLDNYRFWLESWRHLIGKHGLSAGVYTQITDVEHELNGWMTYDREVSKIPVAELRRLHQSLYGKQAEPKAIYFSQSGPSKVELRGVPENAVLFLESPPGPSEIYINGQPAMTVENRGTRTDRGLSAIPLLPPAEP